jgi:hypothetical protein
MGKGMRIAVLLGSILLLRAPADAKDLSSSKKTHDSISFQSGPAPVLAPHQLPTKGKYDIFAFWDSTDPYAFNPYIHGQQIDVMQFGPSTGNAGNGNLHLAGNAKYSMVRLDGLRLSGQDWVNRGGRLGGGKSQYGLLVDVPVGGSAGIIFSLKKRLDLSEYRGVAVEISNVGKSYAAIRGQIKAGAKGIQSFCGLYPGETDVLYFIFRRVAAQTAPQHVRDYFGTFKSKCGYPGGFVCEAVSGGEKGMFRKLSVNSSSLNKARGEPIRFTINRVFGGGRLSLPTAEVLNGPGFKRQSKSETPYLDENKQWKYDDWYMKVKGNRGAYYRAEDVYLARNPGSDELNKYGGWAKGPKLEATGWFRTEKYKGKWWFVDPEGSLFLSQGLCSISGQDVERKLRRFRSWGINTIGGRSALPKIWGRGGGKNIVYCVHMDCNKGGFPFRGPVPADIDEKKYRADWRKVLHNSSWAKHAKDDPWCLGMIVNNELHFGSSRAAEIFYRVTSEEIKKWCPHMLFLDARNAEANHAAKHCDVLTCNKMEVYGCPTHVGSCKTEKPMMFSSFTMGAIDAGYCSYAVSACLTQRHRGRMYKEFCLEAYSHPNIIGCHFYLCANTKFPPIGHCRAFIEGANDMPYYEVVNAAREVGRTMYRLRAGEEGAFVKADDPGSAWAIVTHNPSPVPGPNETAVTPPVPSGTRRGPATAATRRPPPSATRRPPPTAGPKKPKAEALAAYDEALRRRIAEEVKAGRKPEFRSGSMRAVMVVTRIAADGALGVKTKRGPALQLSIAWKRLTLAERKGLALSVVRDGVARDHELAAFYLLAAGERHEGEQHLRAAGDGAARVRESFE